MKLPNDINKMISHPWSILSIMSIITWGILSTANSNNYYIVWLPAILAWISFLVISDKGYLWNLRSMASSLLLLGASYIFFKSSDSYLSAGNYLSILFILPYIFMIVSQSAGIDLERNELLLFGFIACVGIFITPTFAMILIIMKFLTLKQPHKRWLISMAIVAIVLLGFFLHLRSYLYADMAWITYSAKRLMEGAIFGQDVIDNNPPLIWYLSYPVVFLSQITGIHMATVFQAFWILVTTLILLWVLSLMRRASVTMQASLSINALVLVGFYVFLIASNGNMGQREYIAVLLSLPYIITAMIRLNGFKTMKMESLLVGIIAGIGIALKPYFLGVPLAVELTVLTLSRRWIYLRRPEFIAGVMTMIAYGVILLTFERVYLFEVVPLVLKSYWAYEVEEYLPLITLAGISIIGIPISAILYSRLCVTRISYFLIASGFGFIISYLIQKKGFPYHRFPVHALATMALAVLIVEGIGRSRSLGWSKISKPIYIATTVLVFLMAFHLEKTRYWYNFNKKPWGEQKERSATDRFISFLNNYGSDESFLILSYYVLPKFHAIYAKPQWAGIDLTKRHLRAIKKLRSKKRTIEMQVILDELEKVEREQVMIEIAKRPVIVAVPQRSSDILDFYLEDPKFKEAWSNYREIKPIDSLRMRIFERRS